MTVVTNNRCIVCKKPMHTFYDPAEWHADPPPTCSPECKETRKRRREQHAHVLWEDPNPKFEGAKP